MLDKHANKIVIATFATILLLIIGSAVLDFKIFDAMYIVAIITYLIRYKLMKNV